ncbi:MAG: SH3 domain-containing protein [Leptospiraceae bacterium]|nr:SH3 domain-containing protein [Leptospiraceae bacterium]
MKRRQTVKLTLCILLTILTISCKENAIVTATSGLLMRDQPALDGKQLDLLPAGSEVEVLEEGPMQVIDGTTAHWKRVKHNQTEGWVYGGYLVDSKDEATVKQIRDCMNSDGYWSTQESLCYPPQLRKLTQKGTIPGYCGAENYTLFPDGRVWVSGMYVEQPRFLGSWSYQNGDSLVLDNGSGGSVRARLQENGRLAYEQKNEQGQWSPYALAGSASCPW